MDAASAQTGSLWPFAAYAALSVLLVAAILTLSHYLGERRRGAAAAPFESGIVGFGDARLRLSASFYLIAMFFVIFDMESAFLFAWAIAFREVGWTGFIEAMVFIVVLLAGLIYLWRLGALDWGPGRPAALHPGRAGGDR